MAALSVNERAELNKLFINLEYARKPFLLRLLSFSSKKILAVLSGKKAFKIVKSKVCRPFKSAQFKSAQKAS